VELVRVVIMGTGSSGEIKEELEQVLDLGVPCTDTIEELAEHLCSLLVAKR
jgi:hypothetical protein